MKLYKLPIALFAGAALFTFGTLNAATTDPVGYVSINIQGGGASSLISNGGLVQPGIAASGASVATTTVTLPGASWIVDGFAGSHYVQLESGAWSAILSNSETQLTIESSLGTVANTALTIRPLHTLNTLFGTTNSAGFTGGSGLGQADIIAVFDQATQNFSGLYYYNTGSSEWQNSGNNTAGNTIVYPDEAIVVVGKTTKQITITGTVQTGTTSGSLAAVGETTLIPNTHPVDLKISESGYESFLIGGTGFGSADKVFVWDAAAQNFTGLYYYNSTADEWQTAANTTVTNTDVIPVGAAAVVVRANSGSDTWNLQQPFTL